MPVFKMPTPFDFRYVVTMKKIVGEYQWTTTVRVNDGPFFAHKQCSLIRQLQVGWQELGSRQRWSARFTIAPNIRNQATDGVFGCCKLVFDRIAWLPCLGIGSRAKTPDGHRCSNT